MRIDIVKNAKRNLVFGLINKIIVMLCPFIERTVIQYVLGTQYLGLNSLFTSILSVLSIMELGFNSAIVYNMYKPIADGDDAAVNALLNLYKKVYRIIGFAILLIGLCLVPVLPSLISGAYPEDIDLVYVYVFFLINTVVSYFMYAYLTSVLVVYQRDDLISSRNSIIRSLLMVSQVVILQVFKSYYGFIILMPIFTIINNVWIALVVKKQFPQHRCEGKVPSNQMDDIKKLVAGAFIQKMCSATRNSLDSICISAFLGLTLTAIYNNYYMISNAITALLSIMTNAFIGGIGNHVVIRSKEQNFEELKKLDFIYLNLSGWCTVYLLCLYQPFMKLWMGEDMMLPLPAVVLFCIYFYLLKMGDMRTMYSTANGLWWHHKYRSLAEAIMNIILNIVLGKLFGIYGIITATITSLFFCNFIWSSHITFNLAFRKEHLKTYYMYMIRYGIVNTVISGVTYGICVILPECSVIGILIYRIVICSIVPGGLYIMIYRKTEMFKYVVNTIAPKVLCKRNNQ